MEIYKVHNGQYEIEILYFNKSGAFLLREGQRVMFQINHFL